MKLKIEELSASTNLLADKFREVFVSGTTELFTDLISRTKSTKQAFLDFGKSIEQSISQIAAKNISQSLYGEGGAFGKLPGFLGDLFGGGKGAADATGAVALTSSATALTASGGVLATAGSSLIAAAATLGGAGALSGPITLFGNSSFGADGAGVGFGSGIPAFASGISFVPKDMLAVVHKGERITPASQNNPAMGQVYNITQHINVLPGASRASAEQAGAAAWREFRRGQRVS